MIGVGVFWTTIGGPVLVVVGFCSLGVGTYRWIKDSSQPRLFKESIKSFLVLSSNFVAAWLYFLVVIYVTTIYSVQIINGSPEPISTVRIFGGGIDEKFGPLNPGKKRKVNFLIRQDGELRYQIERSKGVEEGMIQGYVTNNEGGRSTIQVEPDGKITVHGAR